ncbi:hypothetical protein CGZ60_08085 [Neisseria animalis]|nr:hypothetical protein CGZ60_08085 [Neisseria animalis]
MVGEIDGRLYLIALKYLESKQEIFLDSFRVMKTEELKKKIKKRKLGRAPHTCTRPLSGRLR